MYKIFIVDDEDWIRERLVNTIDWASVGVEVVGDASNGENALECLKTLHPDILLTDICMPEINGLSLIDYINKLDFSIKTIILSGYDEFEYAKSAVRLGAYAYLLKPVDDNELISTVKEAIDSLLLERKKSQLLQDMQQKLEDNLPIQKKQFIQNLLNGYYKSKQWADEELDFLGLQNKPFLHICFVVEMDKPFAADTSPSDIHLIKFSIANIAEDFLKKIGPYTVIISQSDQIICVVSSDLAPEPFVRRIKGVSYGISTMIKRLLDHTVTIGIGNPRDDLVNIEHSFEEARHAALYRDYLGEDSVYSIESRDKIPAPFFFKQYDIEALCTYVYQACREEALACVEHILEEFRKQNEKIAPINMKILFMDIVFNILKSTSSSKSLIEKEDVLDVEFFNRMYALKTFSDLQKNLTEIIDAFIERTKSARDGGKRRIIEMALEFIEKHYREPITLRDVAEIIYINPSYFCKVFKIETGESFVKYLMQYRIDKAKELLHDPRLKIYEVSEQIGYSDVQYFTKIFKAITGVAPTYYRDKIK